MSQKSRNVIVPPGGQTFLLRILFFHLFVFWVFTPSASAKTLYGKVLKVFDGDTFLVWVQGQEEHVRLREIDAPEVTHKNRIGQEPWGKRAKEFAQSKVKGKTVRLEIEERDERDKYHRLLAYVFWDHTCINQEMVSSGNAFFYPGTFRGKHASELQEAEEVAKEKGVGVFDQKKGLRERPQEFRSRAQWDESLFSKFRHRFRGEKKESLSREYPVPANKIVANKRSMIYHLPGSPGAARVSPKNRVFFDTPVDAEKAGFRRVRLTRQQISMNDLKILAVLRATPC
jgi:micrococcal nuclease